MSTRLEKRKSGVHNGMREKKRPPLLGGKMPHSMVGENFLNREAEIRVLVSMAATPATGKQDPSVDDSADTMAGLKIKTF